MCTGVYENPLKEFLNQMCQERLAREGILEEVSFGMSSKKQKVTLRNIEKREGGVS